MYEIYQVQTDFALEVWFSIVKLLLQNLVLCVLAQLYLSEYLENI